MPVTLIVMTGSSNGLNGTTRGSEASLGRRAFTRSTFSRVLNEAKSIFWSQSNSAITSEMPSLEIDLMDFMPLTVPTASSTGFVNRVSISSGAALAYPVKTVS